jgi:hypothetical protein
VDLRGEGVELLLGIGTNVVLHRNKTMPQLVGNGSRQRDYSREEIIDSLLGGVVPLTLGCNKLE